MTKTASRVSELGEAEYARRLAKLQGARWKQLLDVQRPYRNVIKKYCTGRVLEIGCGTGRNLVNLRGNATGIDINSEAIAMCHARGLTAYTPQDFQSSQTTPGSFDALLMAHVLEHVTQAEGDELLREYLPYIKPGGTVMLICPQERGFASDPTHIRWVDEVGLSRHIEVANLEPIRSFSFPFPRWMGRPFVYNEFIAIACTRQVVDRATADSIKLPR